MGWAAKIITGVAALVVVFFSLPVHAQKPGGAAAAGLAVSPAILEIAANPGETITKEFYIQNISGSAMPVTAALDRLRPHESEINPDLSESFNASQWIKINQPHHILDTEERRKVVATISVPANAEPGGHYATILWQPLAPTTALDGSTAKVAPQVGILVFITVPGDIKYNVGLTNSINRLHWSKNIAIDTQFANRGTIHILPTTKITVKNIFGGTKAELPLKPRIVLPNTRKKFEAVWDKPALFGIYTIEATAIYGPGQTALSSGKKYIVVAQWPLLFLAPVLLAAIVFTLKTRKRWPAAWRAFKGRHYMHRRKN